MDGRKYQRKSGIKRTLVMLLALVMLASVCFPAMRVNAEETSNAPEENIVEIINGDGVEGKNTEGEGIVVGDTKEKGSEDNGTVDEGSEGNGTVGEGTEGKGNEGNGTEGKGTEGNGTVGEGSEGEGSKGEGSEGNGTVGEGTVGEGSEGNGTVGEGSEGNGTEGNGTVGEGSEGNGTEGNGTVGEGTVGEGNTTECNCNAEDGVHIKGCPKYVAPQNDDEDSSMSDAAKNYLSRIEECKAEIAKLDPDASDYEDQWRRIFDDLIIIQRDVSTDWEEYILSDAEFETICYAAEALKNQLGDPYDAATYADDPQMKYYNGNNYLAYDVAWNDDWGRDDYDGKYVAKVTLGDVLVDQKNSNYSGYSGYNSNRVGKRLSQFYPGLQTNGKDTNKKLVIKPAPGYYVTQVVVACCDVGKPYECATWAQKKAFNRTFTVSTDGGLSFELPSSAFGHGAWNNQTSTYGKMQYFILIKVAPVPTPLYIEYDYGTMGQIMGADLSSSVFAKPNLWTEQGGNNQMGTGRIYTQYTRYQYEYNKWKPGDVANWEHYANVVTDEAKEAAAAKGYYFAGWEATYYTECDSNYNFKNAYSDKTTHYDERAKVNLITNVRLVAQWAPIPMKVTKTVTGLPDGDSQPRSYTVQVQKHTADGEWANFGDAVTLQVSGNDTATSNSITSGGAVCPVTPGTYRVVETAGNMDIVIDDATYYVDVTGEEITVVGSPATSYTLNVTNAYSTTSGTLINPDQSYIVVEKVFTGIQKGQIPGDFTITVGGNDKTYTLTNKSDAVNGIQFSESPDGLTWTWKITNAEPGSYVVKESNYGIGDYNHTATPSDVLTQNGANVSVSGSTIGITVTADINSCKNKTFEIDDGKFFAAALTTNSQKCCIVITEQPLSASAKAAITKLITGKGGNWKTENGIFFYSIAQYKGSVVTIMDSDITVNESGNAITFGEKNNWSTALTAEYDYTAAQAGDIQITNGYTLATTSVTVTKTVSGNMGDQGKVFKFTASLKDESMAGITYDLYQKNDAGTYDPVSGGTGTIETNTYDFTLKHDQKIVFTGVKIGAKMTVTETTDYTVTYKIDSGSVTSGKAAQFTVGNSGNTVEFNNTKNATIDTGIVTDSIPYILLLTMAVIGAGVLLNKRRVF